MSAGSWPASPVAELTATVTATPMDMRGLRWSKRPLQVAVLNTECSRTLKDLRIAEVVKLDMTVADGKVTSYRARINVSFKYHAGD